MEANISDFPGVKTSWIMYYCAICTIFISFPFYAELSEKKSLRLIFVEKTVLFSSWLHMRYGDALLYVG
jgi:hypothetical protein